MKKFTVVNEDLSKEHENENKIDLAVKDAKEAFWKVITESFNEIDGDLTPSSKLRFDNTCLETVKFWFALNKE